MELERFEAPGLAHYSYVLISDGHAVVVDPKRDIDTYLRHAAARKARISHVLETHIHADYASGARQLARETGAELWLSGHDDGERYSYRFPHREFRGGEELRAGEARLVALHTPGHTPEHLSFVLYDARRCGYPEALLSGDFLFVGSVGRPDLLGEASTERLAGQLWESVRTGLAPLPDGIEVLPAHGAGSFCGSGMQQRPQSTLGYERACNPLLAKPSKEEFVRAVLGNLPPQPRYYRRMKQINAEGPRLLESIPGGQALSPGDLREQLRAGAVVIDLRRPEAFGGAHIPGALNLGEGPLLSTWAGWLAPYDRPICLVGDGGDCEEARRALVRVGLDDIRGYLAGGIQSWLEAGHEQAHIPQASAAELQAALDSRAQVLDVRTAEAWNAGHIPGAIHIHAGDLPGRLEDLDPTRPVYTICSSGYRSAIAASLLRREGFEVVNVAGGMTAWNAQQATHSAGR